MLRKLNGVKHPIDTRYMIAYSEEDYDAVYKFLKGTEFEKVKVTFPTIIAYVGGSVRGVYGTTASKEAIIAGPLYIKDGGPGQGLNKAKLQIKLIDAYESLLINMGVKAYTFSVKMTDKSRISILKEIGMTPYSKDEDEFWYIRRF